MTPDSSDNQPREPAPDLEYDLAHEGEAAGRVAGAPSRSEHQHIYVATQKDGDDGDYGYDLAHDVPGR